MVTKPKMTSRGAKRNAGPILECSKCRTSYVIRLTISLARGDESYAYQSDCKCKGADVTAVVRATNGHAEYARLPFPSSTMTVKS